VIPLGDLRLRGFASAAVPCSGQWMIKDFVPKKSLGQNFLQDRELAQWIADQVQPETADVVIEIGPGQRALTDHLVGRAKRLILIEKDDQLADALELHYAGRKDVELQRADATRYDLRDAYRWGDVRLVGNLPYSVGTEIIKAQMDPPSPAALGVFMLQKEVCERLAAQAGQDHYGALSIIVQQHWQVDLLRDVPPDSFKPRPAVDSSVIRMTPRKPGWLPVYDRTRLVQLVRAGFSQRRKQLRKLLGEVPHGGWEALIAHLQVPGTVRAEELSVQQWVSITRWFEGRGAEPDRGQKASEMFDVVDEQNQVICQKPRGEVHAQGLRHRAVHVFVRNKWGDLYLQKRSHLKDVHPLVWDSSAAGHLDVGESYAACAVRELEEELGIRVAETQHIASVPAKAETGWEFVELHAAEHSGPMRYAPDEIECGGWFKLEQVEAWVTTRPQDFADGFIQCWQAAKAKGWGQPLPSGRS
jgi:16S rRNA (adenine1518-N6/adenine1519-N6)-dimethyltransferase